MSEQPSRLSALRTAAWYRSRQIFVPFKKPRDPPPPQVVAQFARQLRASGPGALIEAAEGPQSPRIWLMRTGGGAFGEARCACPDHRTAIQQQADRKRDQDHIRAGRIPLRITHGQVFLAPAETTALIAEVVTRLN